MKNKRKKKKEDMLKNFCILNDKILDSISQKLPPLQSNIYEVLGPALKNEEEEKNILVRKTKGSRTSRKKPIKCEMRESIATTSIYTKLNNALKNMKDLFLCK